MTAMSYETPARPDDATAIRIARPAVALRGDGDGDGVSVGEVAQRVGYSSSSTFSVAFARQVGTSPTTYARGHARAIGT